MLTTLHRKFMLAATALGLLSAASTASAQTEKLYLTDWINQGEQTHIYQGGAEIGSFPWHKLRECIIAVVNESVHQADSYANIYNGGTGHSIYDSQGNVIGGSTTPRDGNSNSYDGAFDGERILVVEYPVGTVVSYDLDFTGRQVLFETQQSGELGITYDTDAGTIWTSSYRYGTVRQWNQDGTLLSQFETTPLQSNYPNYTVALAYESSTQTLWAHKYGALCQYDKDGNLLQSIFVSGRFLGAEFDSNGSCAEHIQRIEELENELLQTNELLAAAEAQVAALTSERDALASERDALGAEVTALNEHITSLNQQLAAANARIAELEDTIQAQTAQIATLKARLLDAQIKLKATYAELQACKTENADLLIKLDYTRQKLAATTAKLKMTTIALSETQQELLATQQSLEICKQELDATRIQLKGTQLKLAATTKELQNVKALLDSARATIAKQADQIAKLTNHVTYLKEQVAIRDQKIAAQSEIIQQQSLQISVLSQEVAIRDQKIAAQAAVISDQQATIASQAATIQDQAATIEAQAAQIAGLEEQLALVQQAQQATKETLQQTFDDPSFEIPGDTTEEQAEALATAISDLNGGMQQALYKELGGTKNPAGKEPKTKK